MIFAEIKYAKCKIPYQNAFYPNEIPTSKNIIMKKMENLPASLLVLVAMVLIMVTGCKKNDEPAEIKDGDGNIYSSVTTRAMATTFILFTMKG